MRNTVTYYEARVALGLASLMPALILPMYGVIGGLTWLSREIAPHPTDILRAFALVLPLCAGLIAAHLMSIEREEEFDELRRSYPEPSWRLPMIRAAGALAVTLLSVGVSVLLIRLAGGAYPLDEILLPALPPALFMTGLALLVSNLTGNTPATVVAVVAYWFMDMQTAGQLTHSLYLFHAVRPREDVDAALNPALLIAAAFGLCLVNVMWSMRRRRS